MSAPRATANEGIIRLPGDIAKKVPTRDPGRPFGGGGVPNTHDVASSKATTRPSPGAVRVGSMAVLRQGASIDGACRRRKKNSGPRLCRSTVRTQTQRLRPPDQGRPHLWERTETRSLDRLVLDWSRIRSLTSGWQMFGRQTPRLPPTGWRRPCTSTVQGVHRRDGRTRAKDCRKPWRSPPGRRTAANFTGFSWPASIACPRWPVGRGAF
jgi:hypothetical protein